MREISNPLQACNDIFFHPSAVFRALNEKHNWSWLPFIIVSVLAVLPGYFYFDFVDFDWYRDFIISTNYGDISPSEQQMYRDSMTVGQMQMFALIGGAIGLVIFNAIIALYLNLVTKSDEENLNGFTDWFGFGWWVAMPSIFVSLAALLILAMSSDHQISPLVLSPTSIGYIFNITEQSDWFTFGQSLRLEALWTMYLVYLGVAQWTKLAPKTCAIIAVAPHVVIFGLWALFLAI